MVAKGFPVYGANGQIGYADVFTHADPTILIGCRGSIGSIHITLPRSYATGNAMALDELQHDRVDINFLRRYLAWRGFRDVTTGTSQPQLTRQSLMRLAIPLPEMEEQLRIAAVLDRAAALRAKRGRGLALLHDLALSIFLEMFGAPHSWDMKSIGALGLVVTGKTPPTARPDMFGGPIPFVTPGDLGSGRPVARSVTAAGAEASRVVRKGATLVCCIGATIGKVDVAKQQSAFNQQINAVEWGEQVADAYGAAALRLLYPTIVARGASTTLPLLSKGQFSKLTIPVPPIDIQREFAARVECVDARRAANQLDLAAEAELFASLQAHAFSGQL